MLFLHLRPKFKVKQLWLIQSVSAASPSAGCFWTSDLRLWEQRLFASLTKLFHFLFPSAYVTSSLCDPTTFPYFGCLCVTQQDLIFYNRVLNPSTSASRRRTGWTEGSPAEDCFPLRFASFSAPSRTSGVCALTFKPDHLGNTLGAMATCVFFLFWLFLTFVICKQVTTPDAAD